MKGGGVDDCREYSEGGHEKWQTYGWYVRTVLGEIGSSTDGIGTYMSGYPGISCPWIAKEKEEVR